MAYSSTASKSGARQGNTSSSKTGTKVSASSLWAGDSSPAGGRVAGSSEGITTPLTSISTKNGYNVSTGQPAQNTVPSVSLKSAVNSANYSIEYDPTTQGAIIGGVKYTPAQLAAYGITSTNGSYTGTQSAVNNLMYDVKNYTNANAWKANSPVTESYDYTTTPAATQAATSAATQSTSPSYKQQLQDAYQAAQSKAASQTITNNDLLSYWQALNASAANAGNNAANTDTSSAWPTTNTSDIWTVSDLGSIADMASSLYSGNTSSSGGSVSDYDELLNTLLGSTDAATQSYYNDLETDRQKQYDEIDENLAEQGITNSSVRNKLYADVDKSITEAKTDYAASMQSDLSSQALDFLQGVNSTAATDRASYMSFLSGLADVETNLQIAILNGQISYDQMLVDAAYKQAALAHAGYYDLLAEYGYSGNSTGSNT